MTNPSQPFRAVAMLEHFADGHRKAGLAFVQVRARGLLEGRLPRLRPPPSMIPGPRND